MITQVSKLRMFCARSVKNNEHWVNKRGNTVHTCHIHSGDRYFFDAKLLPEGFKQFDTDQDAWYFGVWVNPEELMTVTYAEGDLSVVTCPTLEHYKAEIQDAHEFYGDPPTVMSAMDSEGNWTEVKGDRPGT